MSKIKCFVDSFAYHLKEYVCKKYKLNLKRMLEDPTYKELHRDKLIKDSNELRVKNPFIWFDAMVEKYKKEKIDVVFIISSDYPRQGKDTAAEAIKNFCDSAVLYTIDKDMKILVVPDLRYHNEVDGFKIHMAKYFKHVVHIHVTTNLDTLFMRVKTHEALYKTLKLKFDRSERELTTITCDPDYVVSNNRSMAVYNALIVEILREEVKQATFSPRKKLKNS